jgi:hypothetical protein
MEKQWPVLHYCENGWKSNCLASAIYSQWYKTYHMKMLSEGKKKKEEERDQKKVKTANEDDDDDNNDDNSCSGSVSDSDTEGSPTPEPLEDAHNAQPSRVRQDNQEGRILGTSRPRARLSRDALYVLSTFIRFADVLPSQC